jgi:sialic acid synthase SpsE
LFDRCLVVAELGINHNGCVETACEMVRAAASAGADAIKVQVFEPAEFCSPLAMIQSERQQDFFERYRLSHDALRQIRIECDRQNVRFFGTATSPTAAGLLDDLGAAWYKVGSDDLTNDPLLTDLNKRGKLVLLSTGMADEREIKHAVSLLHETGVFLLHCVSRYPTPIADANLERITALRALSPTGCVGYSDHTAGIVCAPLAVALGACVIEKHFTLDRVDKGGPDHEFSLDPEQLAALVSSIRLTVTLLGTGSISPGTEERAMRSVARRYVVAVTDLVVGHVLGWTDIAYQRCGTVGIDPGWARYLVGHAVTVPKMKGEAILAGDVA